MEEYDIDCPYCGEQINILIDCSIQNQDYIEDCQVCCSPIMIRVTVDAGNQIDSVTVHQENE